MNSFEYAFGKIAPRLMVCVDGRPEQSPDMWRLIGRPPAGPSVRDSLVGRALTTGDRMRVNALMAECGDTHDDIGTVGYLKIAAAEGFDHVATFEGPIGSLSHVLGRRSDAMLLVVNTLAGTIHEARAAFWRHGFEKRDFIAGHRFTPINLTTRAGAHADFDALRGLRIKLGLVARNGTPVGRWHSLDVLGRPIVNACADDFLVSAWERRHSFDYFSISRKVSRRASEIAEPWATLFDVRRRFKASDIGEAGETAP